MKNSRQIAMICVAAWLALAAPSLFALDPHKALTQYTRAVWTQAQGLPQDTIRSITQTSDGRLWLGTDEGLASFDGYDFITYTRDSGALPSNSITALTAGADGTLWIGTPSGLVRYSNRRFTIFTTKDGLRDNVVSALCEDHNGALWMASGIFLSRYEDGKFTNYSAERLLPVQAVRFIYEDRQHTLWIAGVGGLVKLVRDNFVPVLGPQVMNGDIVTAMIKDRDDGLWIGGTRGLIRRAPDGKLTRFDSRDGLPDNLVRALREDSDGNLWAGTNEGLSRLRGQRFIAETLEKGSDLDWVRCLYEDREGNLWAGMNSGLNRFHDDRFTMYGRTEGFPSDEPIAVHQDRKGEVWIGYHDDGLVAFQNGERRVYTTRNGLPSNEILAIRETRSGDLLIATREGLSRMHDGSFSNHVVPDPLGRTLVFDALEDSRGHIWVAAPSGVHRMEQQDSRLVVPGGPLATEAAVVLSEGSDGSIWAGTNGSGLLHIEDGTTKRFTTSNGLGSDQIHSLYQDRDGTLWIGTFGGGLNALRKGVLSRYTAKDGLLSDNVSHIEDDGRGALWLSTTRGICKISKQQLRDFTEGRIKILTPINYGVEDGLRSAQCAPGYTAGGGGTRTQDGRLWFTTSRGLAVIDPSTEARAQATPPPLAQMVEVTVDGQDLDLGRTTRLQPGPGRVQFRYTGIHLSAPERVRYDYKLEGLDRGWISASGRRVVNYNSLPHGQYRFLVRASIAGQVPSEASFGIVVLPHFYERRYFLWLCILSLVAAIYGIYQLRLKQIRNRFSLVLEERARMAREIHDTLAQGFVGISSQLDAVALKMNGNDSDARQHLALAQKMARHSLTEARRSVMDLRSSALENRDLPSALSTAARQWTAGRPIGVEIEVSGAPRELHDDVEQNVLRIAQEAVTNALKHAHASRIWMHLEMEARKLVLTVKDDGRGFEPSGVFSIVGGHFGLLGMRERAERLGGDLELASQPGAGTQVRVSVPLPARS